MFFPIQNEEMVCTCVIFFNLQASFTIHSSAASKVHASSPKCKFQPYKTSPKKEALSSKYSFSFNIFLKVLQLKDCQASILESVSDGCGLCSFLEQKESEGGWIEGPRVVPPPHKGFEWLLWLAHSVISSNLSLLQEFWLVTLRCGQRNNYISSNILGIFQSITV